MPYWTWECVCAVSAGHVSRCTMQRCGVHDPRSAPPCPCLHVLTASQLQQAYVGMALAVASNRSFILPPVRGWKVWWKGMLAGQESGRWLHAPSSHRLNACKQGASSTPSLPSPPPRVQFKCFCDHIWYSVVRCRVVDAQEMPFPVPWCAAGAAPGGWALNWPMCWAALEGRRRARHARHALCLNEECCRLWVLLSPPCSPQDYLFDPDRYIDDAGPVPPIHIRPASFLANERTPAEVRASPCIWAENALVDRA